MPVLRGAITFSRFRVEYLGERPKDAKRWLAKGFRARAFEPIDASQDQDRAAGWVEIEDNDKTELAPGSFLQGEHVLVSWRIDRLRVPAAMIKAEIESWAKSFEEQKGRPPRRPERAEQRETVINKLRKRVVPVSRAHDVSWSLKTDKLEIWSSSRPVIDEVQSELERLFDLRLVALSPGAYADSLGLKGASLALLDPSKELQGEAALPGEAGQSGPAGFTPAGRRKTGAIHGEA